MHCSPEQVDELLEKLKMRRGLGRELDNFVGVGPDPKKNQAWVDGYVQGLDAATDLVREIFGAK